MIKTHTLFSYWFLLAKIQLDTLYLSRNQLESMCFLCIGFLADALFYFKEDFIMERKKSEEELYKSMYSELYREVTTISEALTAIASRLNVVQCKLEEYYISEGKSNI